MAACLGISAGLTREMRRELKTLEDLYTGVRVMRAELAARLCPTRELTLLAAERTAGETALFLRSVAEGLSELEQKSFCEIWRGACRTGLHSLTNENRERLEALGDTLGRYGLDEQLAALDRFLLQTDEEIRKLREKFPERRRLSFALSAAAGAFLCLLIL